LKRLWALRTRWLLALAVCCVGPSLAAASTATPYLYRVTASAGAAELRVEMELPPGESSFEVEPGYAVFVKDLEIREKENFRPLAFEDSVLRVPACKTAPCALRYRFLLAEAAAQRRSRSAAFAHPGGILAPPSTWLLLPTQPRPWTRCRLEVKTAPGDVFVSGLFPAKGGDGVYEASAFDLADAPYSGFGVFERSRVEIPGAVLEVALTPGERALSGSDVLAWVRASALGVRDYYGRFPVPRGLVIVQPGGRRAVGYGSTMGFGGASIMISLGAAATPPDLEKDWVLTHEMVHFAMPNLPRRYHWFEEGLSTYVEPLIRVRSGRVGVEDFWRELMNGLPRGVSALAARGLDDNTSWSSTYWGGALFCFMVDVAIRERTGNRKSLDDALSAVVAAGGSIAQSWDMDRVIEVGDRATGVGVLRELHQKLGGDGRQVELDDYWKRLGVRRDVDGSAISFDDGAPLAAIRRSLTAPFAIPRP
jgi:hypothetical protein